MQRTHHPSETPDALGITSPWQIPVRNLISVARRVYREIDHDNIAIVAAGIAFYAMLAIFPALMALVSLYGLVSNPTDVQGQVEQFSWLLPAGARPPLQDFLQQLVEQPTSGLSLGLFVGLVGALWSASRGTGALIKGINIAYDRRDTRNFVHQRALALALTIGFILFVVFAFVSVAVLPGILDYVGLERFAQSLVSVTRWPVLAIAVFCGCAILYRVAPNRKERPSWRWVSSGSAIATLLWLIASMLFSVYAASFGDYSKTYGTLAGVIVLLLWFFMSAFALLVGAELNASLEQEAGRLTEGTQRSPPAGAHRDRPSNGQALPPAGSKA